MDEELTDGYSAPCERCAAVEWGVSDTGQFYCKSCHNVIERVQEVDDASTVFSGGSVRAISQGSKRKREERKRDWLLIEGFQFVLMHQADSLLALGVCAQFKDDVLWNLWQRYLQKTKQAYTDKPVCLGKVSAASKEADRDSVVESASLDGSHLSGPSHDSEAELSLGSSAGLSDNETLDSSSVYGRGSAGHRGGRRHLHLLGMPSTLALCHLALLWAREAITLADLLRFASDKHIPYLHVHDVFPDEMRVNDKDCAVFYVGSLPSYRHVQEEAVWLAELMELPAFPSVTLDCMLHPALLSLRYLHDANLPDMMHDWVCRVMEVSGLDKDMALTFNPASKVKRVRLLSYDLQACALIIVAMKLLFRLDDEDEGVWSENCGSDNSVNMADQGLFSLWLWYETLEKALEKAKKREKYLTASKTWKSSNTLIFNKKRRYEILRHRRLAEHLKSSFQKLSGLPPESAPPQPSSFVFRWGEGQGSHGPSFHDTRLDHLTKEESDARLTPANEKYWHPTLKRCKDTCPDHYSEVEATLPRMYVWLLGLFSFLLRVKPSWLHLEVLRVERSFMKSKKRKKKKKKKEEEVVEEKKTGPKKKKKKKSKREIQKKDIDKQKKNDKEGKETGSQNKDKNQDKSKRKKQEEETVKGKQRKNERERKDTDMRSGLKTKKNKNDQRSK
ncbi:TATA box-binding protein-associated factor RNA polymerase I subunit B [Engraulis encrasicolus]|uniref:TATA box-binding protein-associated factor RNA polymerase I subunit B n=1 Tax=Engraulis encrasicolus TaxID=184585 RepID=UPI002FD58802